jgi:hypothetical protein
MRHPRPRALFLLRALTRASIVLTVGGGLLACGASGSVTNDAKPAPLPEPHRDCRTSGCPQLGDTCISQGCGAPWQCRACAKALVEKPVLFCGCDGKTHAETTLGCPQIEIAHDGACSP